MAATAAGRSLTEAHRLAQAAISSRTVARLLLVWPLLDLNNLDATTERWLTAVVPIVASARGESAVLAREYLRQFRAAELGQPPEPPKPMPTPALPVEALRTSLIVTGPVAVKAAMTAGTALDVAGQTAAAASAAVGSRHVLDGGRQTVLEVADADPHARGAYRIASPGACRWCLQVVEWSHGNPKLSGHFESHPGCHCQPEPAYFAA